MIEKLAKQFVFTEEMRPRLTFSDPTKIRLNPDTHRLELVEQGIHYATKKTLYPTDDGLFVRVAATNPTALRKWVGFYADPHPSLLPSGTSVSYRLNDGSDDLYWDGGDWSPAGANNWSPEQDVAAHIDSFPAESQTLSLVINLKTTDKFATPYVPLIVLLMECEIDYFESLIAGSLIPSLESGLRANFPLAVRAPGGTLISLNDLENPINIVEVRGVYSHEDDPKHLNNFFSSYDTEARNIILTTAIPRGRKVWIDLTVQPEVYLNWPSQDYLEVEKIPAIVLDSFKLEGQEIYGLQVVRNIATGQASVRRFPFRLALEFEVLLLAGNNRVLLSMQGEALRHAANNPLLVWTDLDEKVLLRTVSEGTFSPRPNLSDKHQTQYSLRLENIFLWLRPEEVVYLVETFNLTLVSPSA